jgi:polyhydroxyalkanoate synthesis repressor PhaR
VDCSEEPYPVRLIKKYPNRRLYDTQTSVYITLVDVKEMVLAQDEFQVVDAKTGDDLTRSILLQIILEEEASGQPLFSSSMLSQMIRFYGNTMQSMIGAVIRAKGCPNYAAHLPIAIFAPVISLISLNLI